MEAYQAYLNTANGSNNLQVWNVYGLSQWQAGFATEGLKTLETAIQKNPQYALFYRSKARILRAIGQEGPALEAEQMAQKLAR